MEQLERENSQITEDNKKTSSLFDRLWDTTQKQASHWKKRLESKTDQIDELKSKIQQMKEEQKQMMQEAENVMTKLSTRVAILQENKENNEQAASKDRIYKE